MTEPTYTIEQIEQAHMAGQADAGVDPSYSNAQAYVRELTRPAHQFRDGEVYWVGAVGSYDIWRDDGRGKRSNLEMDRRPLRLSEMPAAVSELREALEELTESRSWNYGDYEGVTTTFSEHTLQAALAAFDKAIGEE